MTDKPKNTGQFAKGNPGKPKGAKNKDAALIRDMIAQALTQVGGVDYLAAKAETHPQAFMALIGKVMPVQVTGEDGGAVQHSIRVTFG